MLILIGPAPPFIGFREIVVIKECKDNNLYERERHTFDPILDSKRELPKETPKKECPKEKKCYTGYQPGKTILKDREWEEKHPNPLEAGCYDPKELPKEQPIPRLKLPKEAGIFKVAQLPISVAVDSKDNVWVVNHEGGNVLKLNQQGKVIGTFAVGKVLEDIAIDSSDHAWVTSYTDKTITRISSEEEKPITVTLENYPSEIVADTEDNLWVSTGNNLLKINPQGQIIKIFSFEQPNIIDIAPVKDVVWVALGEIYTQGGTLSPALIKIEHDVKSNDKLSLSDDKSSIPSSSESTPYIRTSSPVALTVDKEDTLWIALSDRKLARYEKVKLTTFKVSDDMIALTTDKNGNIWLVHIGDNSVTKIDKQGKQIHQQEVGDRPRAAAVDSKNNLWVVHEDGTVMKVPFDKTKNSVKKKIDYGSCKKNSDCVLVKNGCCGCTQGGKAKAINKNKKKDYEASLKCASIICVSSISRDSSCSAVPKCIAKKCALRAKKETKSACKDNERTCEGKNELLCKNKKWEKIRDCVACDQGICRECLEEDEGKLMCGTVGSQENIVAYCNPLGGTLNGLTDVTAKDISPISCDIDNGKYKQGKYISPDVCLQGKRCRIPG